MVSDIKHEIVQELKEELEGQVPANRFDLRIQQSLRQILRYSELYSKYLAANYQITSPQLACLISLEGGSVSTKQLAEQVFLSSSTVVRILDKLEEKGLIARERSATDRRLVHVSLTEPGKNMVANCPSPLQESLKTGLGKLPDLEQSTIALALERIVQMMTFQQDE